MFFKLFKKSYPDKDVVEKMMLKIFTLMSSDYSFIITQLRAGIIKDLRRSEKPFVNQINFLLKRDVLNKYEDKNGKYFAIKGIMVFDLDINAFVEVHLYIGYGILLGYSTPKKKILNPNINNINVNKAYKHVFENDDFEKLKTILDKSEIKILNEVDVYEIMLDGKIFYHIKDLENGDFIGIDENKKLYRITHDPYEIIEMNESIFSIFR